ncbi:hypothetical protein [Amycolatopsis keratiniphila]|uniref:hypothetical protein n=1 Tax=Amycolatopsis keratiniphila TaxID=129921 RepID=UPI0013014B05|nr:hypothetical protein [Amycolatopsis keratiniphila]
MAKTTGGSPDPVAARVSAVPTPPRQSAEAQPDDEPSRRRFRMAGVFDGEHDLGRRSKELARHELGGGIEQVGVILGWRDRSVTQDVR